MFSNFALYIREMVGFIKAEIVHYSAAVVILQSSLS